MIHRRGYTVAEYTIVLVGTLIGVIEVYTLLYLVWTLMISPDFMARYVGWATFSISMCASVLSGVEHTLPLLEAKDGI